MLDMAFRVFFFSAFNSHGSSRVLCSQMLGEKQEGRFTLKVHPELRQRITDVKSGWTKNSIC